MGDFKGMDYSENLFVRYSLGVTKKDPKYKLKDPMGKTVGKYVSIKGARKKGYDLQNGMYSRYDVYTLRGSPVGYIDYSFKGHRQVYWHEKGRVFYIWADGSISEIY